METPHASFAGDFRKVNVDEHIIEQITNIDYPRDEKNSYKDSAHFYAKS